MKSPRLIARQKASFADLAAKAGLAVDELERRLHQNFLDTHITHSNNLRRLGTTYIESEATQKFNQSLLRCSSYWECLDVFEPLLHKLNVALLARNAQNLPLDWSYLERLSQKYSLPCPTGDAEAFKTFLASIPAAYLFTHEFNAFLEHANINHDPPCIHYHFLLQHTLTECASIFSCYWEVQVSPDTFPKTVALPAKVDFHNEILRLISILLGERLFAPRVLTQELGGAAHVGCASMEMSSLLFVACHEYAHLLLGHLEKPYTKLLEYEADLFAAQVLSQFHIPNRELGITAVYAVLDILENIYPPGNSHPTSVERLSVVANQSRGWGFDDGGFDYATNAIREVFNASIQARFGRRVFQRLEE